MRAAIAACGHPKNLHDPYKLSLRHALGVGPACWAAIAAYNLQVTDSLSLLSLLMVWFLPLGLPAALPLAIRRQEAGTGPWGSHQNCKEHDVDVSHVTAPPTGHGTDRTVRADLPAGTAMFGPSTASTT